MNIIDKTIIKQFHEMRTRAFGAGTSQALGWRDDYSQYVRFKMLRDIGDMNDHTVLDVGCGYGDLREYLNRTYPRLKYLGIDQVEAFLAVAETRYTNLPDTSFYLGDFSTAELPAAHYVFASGSLNYRTSDPNYIYKMISKFFDTCQLAFGFNLLRSLKSPDGLLAAYPIEDIMRHCRTLTGNIVLYDKYDDQDFTIWMYKA